MHSGRRRLRRAICGRKGMSDIEEIVRADAEIDLGDTGMGMPVIRSWQRLKGLPLGAVLKVTSSHP